MLESDNSSYIKSRISSFGHAIEGLKTFLIREPFAKLHWYAAVAAVIVSIVLDFILWEWIIILGCITMVLVLELLNTIFEELTDLVSEEFDVRIKRIKDYGGAMVLIASIFSALTFLMICVKRLDYLYAQIL